MRKQSGTSSPLLQPLLDLPLPQEDPMGFNSLIFLASPTKAVQNAILSHGYLKNSRCKTAFKFDEVRKSGHVEWCPAGCVLLRS